MVEKVVLSIDFVSTVIEWRGPAPFLFAPIPEVHFGEIRFAAHEASYGWGVVPVTAKISGFEFRTSLFPRADTYLLPIKIAVQKNTGVGLGDAVYGHIIINARY